MTGLSESPNITEKLKKKGLKREEAARNIQE
jgi:hypothetical protein